MLAIKYTIMGHFIINKSLLSIKLEFIFDAHTSVGGLTTVGF